MKFAKKWGKTTLQGKRAPQKKKKEEKRAHQKCALQKKAAQKKRKAKGWAPFFYQTKIPFFWI